MRQTETILPLSLGPVQESQFIKIKLSVEEENLLNLIAEILVQKTLSITYEESITVPTLQQRRSEST